MEEFQSNLLNRGALTIIPKKPFWDWVNYLTPASPVDPATHDDYNTYLIRDEIPPNGLEEEIRKHFKDIFEMELEGWWMDETAWPQTRTWEVFNEWFKVNFSAMIIDLEQYPRLKLE